MNCGSRHQRALEGPSPSPARRVVHSVCLALLVMLLFFLGGCSPLSMVNTIAPDDGFVLDGAIGYGPLERQKLDVYYPEVRTPQKPVLVFFYGGSWLRGDRQKYRFVGQALSSRGYVTVIPDYRLYPEVQFPVFIEDGAASVAWVKDNIAESANGIVLIGHSAGAHLAALLALDNRYLEQEGISERTISGMIGLAGPYAFEPENFRRFRAIFATAHPPEISRPITYARGDAPPLLLLHGTDDNVVLPLHSQLLQERVDDQNGRVTRLELEGVDHFDIVLGLSEPFTHLAPGVLPCLERFIREQT
ncbi:alpha/beta hydrolase [Desulfosediminicola ganghwensis]|uniref:alpha/beta hydrolase n=1 Tax=Desulfosediminicola ganghwensis TaxID=2569540 RepID=UPI00142EB3B1|nr:alpha/beta hydrolase [Desulfosediminicola ganghwensis]